MPYISDKSYIIKYFNENSILTAIFWSSKKLFNINKYKNSADKDSTMN